LITGDVYLNPILNNSPRLLGLLNRNISSVNYGCFDREFWHYNTMDFACARKQEAVLTFTLLYIIKHEHNKYYHKNEILEYIKAALIFWTTIQNKNGSFNEWYPNEHSFVVTSFSSYAVSESLLLLKDEIPQGEYNIIIESLRKAGDWLVTRNETRVMNQQTGAAIALLNLYLLTNDIKYLDSSRRKISLLNQRQSKEGWFFEYGGPDIGYLSLTIDYLSKYYLKTSDEEVLGIIGRALNFIKHFIQPNLVAGGEYTSRNTEYLIPHGFEIISKVNEDALFAASVIRKKIDSTESLSFPDILDDRYLTYNGYTWLQAYLDSNAKIDEALEENITNYFNSFYKKYYEESGLLVINDEGKHFIVNVKKGGAFRLFDKKSGKTYSDSGIMVKSGDRWYTSGWLAQCQDQISDGSVTVSGNMWRVSDKTLTTVHYIFLRLFQVTLGRSCRISLWLKERLRDFLITGKKPSDMRYKREIMLKGDSECLLRILDSVVSRKNEISDIYTYAKDTHIYVPSSRYYSISKEPSFQKSFPVPVDHVTIEWKAGGDADAEFVVN
jgi:hypothetical protein